MSWVKSHLWYLLAIIVLLALNMLQLRDIAKCEAVKREMELFFSQTGNREQKLTSVLERGFMDEGRSIPDSIFTINRQYISRSQLVNDGSVLVFRFSEHNCRSCVDQAVKLIKQYCKNRDKLILLATYNDARTLKLIAKELGLIHPIYRVSESFDVNLRIKELNIPYFFVLDQEFRFKQIFYLFDHSPQLIETYFQCVSDRFGLSFDSTLMK